MVFNLSLFILQHNGMYKVRVGVLSVMEYRYASLNDGHSFRKMRR